MNLSLHSIDGKSHGEVTIGFELIEDGRGTQAVHDTVVAFRAGNRSGTANTKTKGEVQGSGKKPWKQKGTGRARAGMKRSPLWVGGGVVFGPRPRDFSKKVNRVTKQLALRKALSARLSAGDLVAVDSFTLADNKTKTFLRALDALKIDSSSSVLVLEDKPGKNLLLATRNVPGVELASADSVNAYQILLCDKLVVSKPALEKITERLK